MSKNIKLIIIIGVFALLLLAAGAAYKMLSKGVVPNNNISLVEEQSKVADEVSDMDNEKQKAPDFAVIDMDGNTVKLSDMIGTPIVLNFWASWCSPCKNEMPEFNKVSEDLSEGVLFMMVNLTDGSRETIESATKYVEEQGFTFPVYFDTAREAAYTYGIQSIPTTIFIDKDGYIVAGAQGMIDEKILLQGIEMIQ